jgi:hypothetical protein
MATRCKTKPCRKPRKIKGVVIVHAHVGTIGPDKVDAYIKKVYKDRLCELSENLKLSGYDLVYIPTRMETKVEIIKL